jgi:tripartite ATP-independent transporter DctM subunit
MFYWEDYLSVYMFGALAMLLFSGIPVAFVLGGVALGFGFLGASVGMFSVIEFFNILPRVWGGAADNLVLVAVPCFIFMGTMLERSGVAEDLLNILQVLMRRVPGGLAMAVIGMGTIMAATTGIIGASVVMMTMLALPTMLRARYSTELACGTIASSATLGILIPPSIMLVIMADLMAISVGNLFLGAIIPGLVLSTLYCVYVYTVTRIRPELAPPLPADQGVRGVELVRLLARGFVPPVVLIVMVLGSIFAGIATPTEAAGVGAFGSLLLAAWNRRLTIEVTRDVAQRTALTTGMVFFIIIGATAFSYVFRSLGGEDIIVHGIEGIGLGSWGLLVLLMAIVFFLGFFFDWIEITLIVLPVFGPIVAAMDFGAHVPKNEMIYWFAILLSVNLQTSFLTPPFGFALFYLKGVAPPEVKIQHIYRGIIPFVTLQLIGLIAVIGFPGLSLWLPRMMYQ